MELPSSYPANKAAINSTEVKTMRN